MDKVQKFEFNEQIKQYMHEQEVYELFQSILRNLIIEKPEDPLEYIINYLGKEPTRRVFLMGPPGSFRQENAISIAEHFNWKCITTGDLLRKEVKNKSAAGKAINARFKAYEFVDDAFVIDLVHAEIKKCEANGESWIC